MPSTAVVSLLQSGKLRVFTTGDFASLAGLSTGAASQALRRLALAGAITRVRHAIWANRFAPDFNPFEIVPVLQAPWPAYVSLHSALSEYGLVAEIPQVIYGISASRPRRLRTPAGDFHLHHLPERLIWGFAIRRAGRSAYPIADPEKAFLDLCYLALTLRSPLGLPRRRGKAWNLDKRKVRAYAARFKYPPLLDYLRGEKFTKSGGRL